MRPSTTVNKLALWASWIAVFILILLPFHAFLTAWLSSGVGHYTLLRLWKEFLLVPIILTAAYILIVDANLRRKLFSSWIVRLICLYAVVLLLWAFIPLSRHDVTGKAMWYGLLVDLRFLAFFVSIIILATKSQLIVKNWPKILFAPAVLVAAFAVLQYLVLPYDFLKHFGYGESTISPYETINHNVEHIRVASTLRGANPLGAYLILPIAALGALLLKNYSRRRDGFLLGFGLILALAFSFSRSAWIGAFVSLLIVGWLSLKSERAKRLASWTVAVILIIGVLTAVILRNNTSFENVIFHTDHKSQIATSSNEGHSAAFKGAAKDIIHQPWGGGVGTAGPQSIYNNKPGRIAENYFFQVGQEAGILGMALFIAICIAVGKLLWKQRSDSLAFWLFASFIGITFVNLLSHAWTDDTLAYLWWGLAGVALAPTLAKVKLKRYD